MKIDFAQIPDWWEVCQNTGCPKAAGCLRQLAFRNMPDTVTKWPCVMPWAMKDGECKSFFSSEKVRLARGFNKMFARVRNRDDKYNMRRDLTDYLGSKGSYYRYKDGERILNPEQQQWILQLFLRYGYEEPLEFDEYVDNYDFKRHQ